MQNRILVIVATLLAGVSYFAIAESDTKQENSIIRTITIQPCSNWSSIRTDGGSSYTCAFRGNSITVPDGNDVKGYVRKLEDTISNLEQRVAALEAEN